MVSFQGGPQRWKLLVSLQSSEASGRFLHGGRGPAHRHRGRAPSLHVPAYAPHRAHDILDDVGTGERAPQLLRQSKARDGENIRQGLKFRRSPVGMAVDVVSLFMALLSFVKSPPRAYRLKASNAASPISTSSGPFRAQRTGWRKPRGCRTIHADQPPYDIWLAGAVSARWLGSAESQTAFGQAAQTGCARLAMDLQHHHAEEPVATEVRFRAVDACHGGKADQG